MIDALQNFPGYLLRRASAVSLAELSTLLAPLDIRPAEATILTLIANNENATQSDLGAHLGIQRANMTPIIARIEGQGWITRIPLDGRSQALVLTALGNAVQQQAFEKMQSYETTLLERVPAAYRENVVEMLSALWRNRG
jgi:DNA-binding MarR family transcriptional regulator